MANQNRDKKKEAVKKVIAAMTVGKDVSMLFSDVLMCMQTGNRLAFKFFYFLFFIFGNPFFSSSSPKADLELKKLVYLYLMNYAKSQPQLAILAVNTFVKVAKSSPFPLSFFSLFSVSFNFLILCIRKCFYFFLKISLVHMFFFHE